MTQAAIIATGTRATTRARTWWLRLHRWLAWSLGVLLALVVLLGAALIVLKPIDRALNARLFEVPATSPAADLLERTREALAHEFSGHAALTFRPPRASHDSLWVIVRGPWRGTVYVDPASGRELGRRGEHEGLFNLAFEIHSTLLLDEAGKPILAALAASYFVLLASGLVLWWPRQWRRAWALALDRGRQRALFDLHRLGGSLLGLLIAVPIATGAYMAWKPLAAAVSAWAGHAPPTPPRVKPAADGAIPRTPLDRLVIQARATFPDAMVGDVQVPAAADKPVRVRLKLADDPHPNGLTSIWCHPRSGEVLQVQRWDRLDAGARAYVVVYPLHTGTLGGPWLEVLNLLLGLALVALAVTGCWLWWLRRGAGRARGTAHESSSRARAVTGRTAN